MRVFLFVALSAIRQLSGRSRLRKLDIVLATNVRANARTYTQNRWHWCRTRDKSAFHYCTNVHSINARFPFNLTRHLHVYLCQSIQNSFNGWSWSTDHSTATPFKLMLCEQHVPHFHWYNEVSLSLCESGQGKTKNLIKTPHTRNYISRISQVEMATKESNRKLIINSVVCGWRCCSGRRHYGIPH